MDSLDYVAVSSRLRSKTFQKVRAAYARAFFVEVRIACDLLPHLMGWLRERGIVSLAALPMTVRFSLRT